MIGYCPIEEEPVAPPPRPKKVVVPQTKPGTVADTDCKYFVMFFSVGVLPLAFMETLGR